jgi:hypothetical protein
VRQQVDGLAGKFRHLAAVLGGRFFIRATLRCFSSHTALSATSFVIEGLMLPSRSMAAKVGSSSFVGS